MQTDLIVSMVVTISVILFPEANIWYLNIGGVFQAILKAKVEKAAANTIA